MKYDNGWCLFSIKRTGNEEREREIESETTVSKCELIEIDRRQESKRHEKINRQSLIGMICESRNLIWLMHPIRIQSVWFLLIIPHDKENNLLDGSGIDSWNSPKS